MKAAAPGLDIRSPTRIKFPDLCARWGTPTRKTIPVKIIPGEPGPSGNYGSVIPLGGLHGAIADLHAGSAKIPCCSTCRRPYVIGYLGSIACLIIFALIWKYLLPANFMDTASGWDIFIAIVITGSIFMGFFISVTAGQEIAAPVRIWRATDGYHYRFFSGAYRDWAKSQDVQPPER